MGALIAEEVRCAAAIKAFVREVDAAMEKAIRLELWDMLSITMIAAH